MVQGEDSNGRTEALEGLHLMFNSMHPTFGLENDLLIDPTTEMSELLSGFVSFH